MLYTVGHENVAPKLREIARGDGFRTLDHAPYGPLFYHSFTICTLQKVTTRLCDNLYWISLAGSWDEFT